MMTSDFIQKYLPVLTTIGIIILIAVIQEKSKLVAAIAATAPLTAPLALWIVYKANLDDYTKAHSFFRLLTIGTGTNILFFLSCYLGFKFKWPFYLIMVIGYGSWAISFALCNIALKNWVSMNN